MHVRELVLHVVAPALGVTLLGGLVLAGPWSPLALDRANARYAGGDLKGAVAAYEAVGESWQTPATRAEAWRRAGMIRRGQGDVRGAVRNFEHAAELAPSASVREATLAELGLLYKDELKDPRSCAEAFEHAALESTTGEEDLAAADCWVTAGDTARAQEALTRAAARPSLRKAAEKALAALDVQTGATADGAE
jgi:tetratricopeptide (TPR) repeat protein